jgi:RNA polymerase sigma factor (sigma-70 family)
MMLKYILFPGFIDRFQSDPSFAQSEGATRRHICFRFTFKPLACEWFAAARSARVIARTLSDDRGGSRTASLFPHCCEFIHANAPGKSSAAPASVGVGAMVEDDSALSIYMEHRVRLIEYAAPIVGSRHWAEDVVQEAYLRFSQASLEHSESRGIRTPRAYLYRIVRNLATDWAKHLALERPDAKDSVELDMLPAVSPNPEEEVLYKQRLLVLAAAICELPDRTRRAFEMHRLQGRTLKCVAAELGVSIALTHQLVHQAVGHCLDRLEEDRPRGQTASKVAAESGDLRYPE